MRKLLVVLAAVLSPVAVAGEFEVHSSDLSAGQPVGQKHVFSGYGCDGDNVSPALSWSGAPEGTKSFAVTVHDPDAPTASGWWHWLVYDIPVAASGLPTGASTEGMSNGAVQARNDFGQRQWGGPCPPKGDDPHRYRIRVFALDTAELELPEDASAALVSFQVRAHGLARARITVTYGR